jgi:hypothetical protein
VTLPPARNLSLFQIEDGLQSLLDSAELVEPEQEAEFMADLERSLKTAVNKRDKVSQFLAHCEAQPALADAEIKRLQARKKFFEAVVERVGFSVIRTIRNLGADEKGRYKTLEGSTSSLGVRRCPPTVAITDEAAVPASFKSITFTLPAELSEEMFDALDLELRGRVLDAARRSDVTVSKTLLKEAIEAAAPAGWREALKQEDALPVRVDSIPGAAIIAGALSLVRK